MPKAEASTAPHYIVIHHTDIDCSYKPEQVNIIESAHQRRNYPISSTGKFIAYHYFIGCDGTLKNTRPEKEPSIHTGCGMGEERCKPGFSEVNEHSIAVTLAGDLEKNDPTSAQIESLKKIVTDLQKKYSIPKESVIPHSSASPTSCPGEHVINALWN